MTVKIHVLVVWVMTPYSLVNEHALRHFGGTYAYNIAFLIYA